MTIQQWAWAAMIPCGILFSIVAFIRLRAFFGLHEGRVTYLLNKRGFMPADSDEQSRFRAFFSAFTRFLSPAPMEHYPPYESSTSIEQLLRRENDQRLDWFGVCRLQERYGAHDHDDVTYRVIPFIAIQWLLGAHPPPFTLSRERMLQSATDAAEDINFPDDPDFSRRVLLTSRREGEVRRLFTRELRDLFRHQKRAIHAECIGARMLFWHDPRKMLHRNEPLSPTRVQELLDVAEQFCNHFDKQRTLR